MAALNEHGQYELTDFDAEILELLRLIMRQSKKQLLKSSGSIKHLITSKTLILPLRLLVYQKYLAETGISARLLSRLPLVLINSQL